MHYFNRITGKNFDLTSQERYDHPFDDYDGCVEVGISKKSRDILEKKKDMRTAFGCIEYSHGLLDALRMIHGLI